MSVKTRNFKVTAAVTILLIAVVIFGICLFCNNSQNTVVLLLRNQDDGKVYKTFDVDEGDIFSVEFIHSVNKSPVCDYFEIKDGEIYAVRTKYSAFSAGVQTEIADGQTLTYDENNNMIVSGFDLKFNSVRYIVGTVSDHVLEIGGKTISLRELCGKNAHIEFVIKRQNYVWQKIGE